MSKISKIVIILFFTFIALTQKVYAKDVVNINDLIENAIAYDQKEVAISGEAIGEGLERGSYTWINIVDRTNAIGVWIPKEEAADIQCFGDYKHKGDTVLITGMLNRACIEHGGETDFHSSAVQIIQKGHTINENISIKKLICLAILLPCVLMLLPFYSKSIGKRQKNN